MIVSPGCGDAFQERVPAGKHPVLAVYVDIDPAKLDVNVHPQKLEVRFSDGQAVFQAFSEALAVARQLPDWSERLGTSTPETASLGLGVDKPGRNILRRQAQAGNRPAVCPPTPIRRALERYNLILELATPRASSELPKVQLGLG